MATLCIALLTILLAKETWHLRSLQQDQIKELQRNAIKPNVELYLEANKASFQLMDIHIENFGPGTARNICFAVNTDLAKGAANQSVVDELNRLSMFKNGIAALGSGKKRSSHLINFLDLARKFDDHAFLVKLEILVEYKDSNGNPYANTCYLDLSEYEGIHEVGGGDPLHQIFKEIQNIGKIIEKFKGTQLTRRLEIDIWDSQDRAEEKERQEKQIARLRNKK